MMPNSGAVVITIRSELTNPHNRFLSIWGLSGVFHNRVRLRATLLEEVVEGRPQFVEPSPGVYLVKVDSVDAYHRNLVEQVIEHHHFNIVNFQPACAVAAAY